jgi:hypothetical protein
MKPPNLSSLVFEISKSKADHKSPSLAKKKKKDHHTFENFGHAPQEKNPEN